MSYKQEIIFSDFDLFLTTMKSTAKLVESAKLIVDENGLSIYGARERIARCEIKTNSIYAKDKVEFVLKDLSMFVKILTTASMIHKDDTSDLKFYVELPHIKLESKKFKNRLICCDEQLVEKWISKPITTELKSVFEFTTSSDEIKLINSHAFVYQDQELLRIYLENKPDMEKNSLYATIGNRNSNLSNEITLKLGLITFGTLDKPLIINLERLNLFNAIQSKEIKVSLMDIITANGVAGEVLTSSVKLLGKNGTFFTMNIYNTMLRA